ncbi:MAG: SHOCT domain-containing protein [Chloroflexota bacterium]
MSGWTMGIEAWLLMGAWALVMVLVVWLLVREPRHQRHDDPGTILRARFARGEISEEEFKRASEALADPPVTSPIGTRRYVKHAHSGQEARHD